MNRLTNGRGIYTSRDIAVVIPAYNCEDSILDCLESIFAQSGKPGEVIVINDGSNDQTESQLMCSRYWQHIRYCRQENAGPAAARNKGISLTEKDWVAFLDADDRWIDEDKLLEQIILANRYPDASLIDTFAKVDWHGKHELIIQRQKQGDTFNQFLHKNAVNATSSVLAKKSLIDEVGGFVEQIKFGEDRLLWAELALKGGVYTVPKVTVLKINQVGNLTSKGQRNYHYRVALVKRLIAMTELSAAQQKVVWMVNLSEFLRLAYQANNSELFLEIFKDARRRTGLRVWISKYFPLAVYAKLFGSFVPLRRFVA